MSLPTLAELRAQAETIPVEEIPEMLERLAEVRTIALQRLREGPPPSPKDEVLTVAAAAKLLGSSEWYVESLVSKGELGHVRLPATKGKVGRLIRIMGSDIADLLERSHVEPGVRRSA